MHVAGLVLLEPGRPITMRELRHHVASRIHRLPRFRQVLRDVAFGAARPEWEQVSRIDYDAHLIQHTLHGAGGIAQLHALCGRIHETLLSHERPLWELHLVDGIQGGRQALIVKSHHSITDGIAGVEVAQVLFDRLAAARHHVELPATRFSRGPERSVLGALQGALGVAFTAAGGPLALSGPFNGHVGAERAFATASLPVEDLRRAKRRYGGSVDDVVITTVAIGLRAYLAELGYPDPPAALRAMLPVSTRPPSDHTEAGNQVTSVFLDLPMHEAEFGEVVREIATAKSYLRTAHCAAGMSILVEAAGLLPNVLHEGVVRFAAGLQYANVVLSDVPGPDEPMALLGRRIAACYPMIPLPPKIGLSIATLSLGGVMGVGIVADPSLVPSPHRIGRAVERALGEAVPHSGHARPQAQRRAA